jgi:hypothetical protein
MSQPPAQGRGCPVCFKRGPACQCGVEHVCDATVPVCSCGHAWTHYREYSAGERTYMSQTVVDRYLSLYGTPRHLPFHKVTP